MPVFTQWKPFFRRFLFIIFNAEALRKAFQLHLFSLEFLLGVIGWAISAGILLFFLFMHVSWPVWFMLPVALFAIFTGCCWVAFPCFVFLAGKLDQLSERRITPGSVIRAFTGVSLWSQAMQGKLPRQFSGAILLDCGLLWLCLDWHASLPWQALFHFAFFINTVFYVALPSLLFFLGQHLHRHLL